MELFCRFVLLASLFSFSSSVIMDANEGEAYVIQCTNDMSIKANVTWYRQAHSELISSNESDRVHSTGNNLWFLPTSFDDTGIYFCILIEYNWSPNFTLKIHPKLCSSLVLYEPLRFSSLSYHIVCPDIDLYDNKTTIIWYKDCKPMKGNHKTIKNVIVVNNATSSDAGNYTCTFSYVHNGKAYNVTRTRTVEIVEKTKMIEPKFYTPFNGTVEAGLGTSVNLTCSALVCFTCRDFYYVYWQINNTDVNNGSRFIEVIRESPEEVSVDAILTIVKVLKEDYNSNFSCIAGNDEGVIRQFVVLRPLAFNKTQNIIVVLVCLGILCCLLNAFNTRLKIDLVLLFRDIFKSYRARNNGKDYYDAYVIYPRSCHEQVLDNPMEYFVNTILLDVLEHKCGYNLFLPGRNTVPGEDIANSSTENIEKSRRLIVILSSQVKSIDSLYDQQVGLHNALLNNIKMIIIALDDINKETEMQESLRYMIKQNGIIKWQEKSKNNLSPNSRFWKLVRYQMPGYYGNWL
ncbi:interleukin-1 receptor-like 1 [Phyllobates terribilis]|uniref:interleukin-1 receptor-like 1 n=1 Tax=Phyllobates terribilis TaxID=111132 RepID=UPI003CCAADEE